MGRQRDLKSLSAPWDEAEIASVILWGILVG